MPPAFSAAITRPTSRPSSSTPAAPPSTRNINGNNPLNNLTLNGGVLTSTSGQSTWGAWNINGTVTATGNSTITNSGGANQETLLASGTGATTTTMNVVNASDLLTITTSLLNGRDTASPYTAHATGLTKTGAGALTLTGTNTYTGTTTVSNGVLQLTSATATGLATNSSVKLFTASGSLDLNFTGTNQVAALYIDGVAQPNGVYGAAGTHITGTGYLKVVAITPPTLTMTNLGGGQLQFSWTGSGNLQAQTNSLSVGLGTNWVDYPGASPVTITINPANGSVFYRVKQ